MKRHRKYRGVPTAPTAEQAPEVFRQNMIEQFGSPDGPKHGGKRLGAGRPEIYQPEELGEKYGVLSRDPARIAELKAIYPNLMSHVENMIAEKRILEFMRILVTRPSARVMWRSTVERQARAMEITYDMGLQFFREADSRLNQNGTVAQLHTQVAHMAQHLVALGHELVAREGGNAAALRELRESLKFVAQLAGLGPKVVLELQEGKGAPAPPVGDPRRGPWARALRERMAAGVAELDAELERERDAGALTAGGADPDEAREKKSPTD